MLIRNAELDSGERADVRVKDGAVAAVGKLANGAEERVLDARGCLLLPGLHDHHIHVAGLAAARISIPCGPPQVGDGATLAAALQAPGTGWLRGVGYHESVAGMLDLRALDAITDSRPVRIQHRSGRMWFLNSAALDLLLAHGPPPPGLERAGTHFTGRLFDSDAWLRRALAGTLPAFASVGAALARLGVTGLTDMSPANDARIAAHFAAERARGAIRQRIVLAGQPGLAEQDMAEGMTLGPVKFHLHEAKLPTFDEAVRTIDQAHALGRAIAVHCATEVELVFALAAFAEASAERGDRIEHASLAPDTAVDEIARLGLAVVSQPHFIAERGDIYRAEIDRADQSLLYRLQAFRARGVALAGGSDAPYGGIDPWAAMAAAVSRRTGAGAIIGPDEALAPEAALDLYLRDPVRLERRRRIEVGAPADLCLLDRGWDRARSDLGSVRVRAVWIDGRQILNGVDQTPA